MRKKTWTMAFAAGAFAAGLSFAYPSQAYADTFPKGSYAGDISLEGMTREEAAETVKEKIFQMETQTITLVVGDHTAETTAGDLGFAWNNPQAVEEAADSFETGNLIERYLARTDIEENQMVIPLDTGLDDGLVTAFVEENCASASVEAQDAQITRENGQFVVTPSVTGQAVDTAVTKQAVQDAVAGGLDEPVTVTAQVTETQPARTTEALSTIQDVLGTFSTSFASSGTARATNVRVGASKINGRVLMPGETLSGYECLNPFTTDNGYMNAASYENGQVVDSIGGGVCQISTTLYNAALRAELEITQRQNHSMIVTYVKPSEDAAIAGTYKDLKITNNYQTPIYVEGLTEGRTLTFTIYGQETRPENRTVEFVSETISVTDPGAPKEELDPTLPPGSRRQVQSAHTGMKSRLWKYIYVDGVEQSREILHTDTYNASKAIVKVGPAVPAVAAPEETTPAETVAQTPETTPAQPTEPVIVEGINGGPGVTAAELETAASPEHGPGGDEETAQVPAGPGM